MPGGEKLFRFLARLMLRGFCGTVTMRFEAGKATYIETETRQTWRYQDLPSETSDVSDGGLS